MFAAVGRRHRLGGRKWMFKYFLPQPAKEYNGEDGVFRVRQYPTFVMIQLSTAMEKIVNSGSKDLNHLKPRIEIKLDFGL